MLIVYNTDSIKKKGTVVHLPSIDDGVSFFQAIEPPDEEGDLMAEYEMLLAKSEWQISKFARVHRNETNAIYKTVYNMRYEAMLHLIKMIEDGDVSIYRIEDAIKR